MNVALVIISDRGDLYLPQCLASLEQHVPYDWHITVQVDDQAHHLGLAGAVRAGWQNVPEDTDYVFHVEEDFLFNEPVDIDAMAECLRFNPYLAQLVLKRQPGNPEEAARGGIIECHPKDYLDRDEYVEHRRIFSLNPCLIPKAVIDLGWPDGNEAEFTQMCLAEDYTFAFWGKREDPPRVHHIGLQRSAGWKL